MAVVSTSARADAGVPMLAIFLPPMWLALVPVIFLEAFIIKRFSAVRFGRALAASSIANIASTIVGVPVAWVILAVGEMLCCGGALGLATPLSKIYAVTVQAPWLIPYESDLPWMVPAALATLGIIFAAVSIAIETPIASRILRAPSRSMWRAMTWANGVSYIALGFLAWATVKSGVKVDSLYQMFEPVVMALAGGVFGIAGWLLGNHAF